MAYTPTLWAKGDVVTSEKLNKIEQGIVDKVDKVDGKGLSTNDYTDQDKAKLDGLESQIDHLESLVGSPLVASTAAEMTNEDKVYVYTGNETGYQNGYWYYYDGTAWTQGGVYNSVAINVDDTLSISGVPADAKKTGDEIGDLKSGLTSDITYIKKSGRIFTDDVKSALFNLLEIVVYTTDDAQDYINALSEALNPQARLMRITAVFDQGGNTITDHDSLETLKQYLTVTGLYVSDDGSFTDTVTDYTLTGTLTVGTSNITVATDGLTTSFSVEVTQWTRYTQKEKLLVSGSQYIDTGLYETDLDGCRYEYKVTPQNTGGSSGHILSSAQNYIPYPQPYGTSLTRRIFTVYRGKASNSANGANVWEVGEDLTFVVDYSDDQNAVVVNGITRIASTPAGTQELSASNQYVMFGYGGGKTGSYYRFQGAFYYMKIFDSEDALIHHFVPAFDNVDNVAGALDLCNDTFYKSATSSNFTVE